MSELRVDLAGEHCVVQDRRSGQVNGLPQSLQLSVEILAEQETDEVKYDLF